MTSSDVRDLPARHTPERILDPIIHPGGNVTLNLQRGTVTVNLDAAGDWTITVGVRAGTDKTRILTDGLRRVGFFEAAESEGIFYLLWTSAFEDASDARRSAENVLYDVLKTIQEEERTGTAYIC